MVTARTFAAATLMAVSAMALSAEISPEDSPTAVVARFQAVLLAAMKTADEGGYHSRYKQLAPAVEESHALSSIARVTVGRYWKKLSDAQKALFVETFSELSIAIYAHRFDAYSGEAFEVISEEQPSSGKAVVHTLLTQPSGDQVRLDYMLRLIEGHWRIVNIIADGVSDLALKRAEYTSIIRRQGIDALITELRDKISQYSEAGG